MYIQTGKNSSSIIYPHIKISRIRIDDTENPLRYNLKLAHTGVYIYNKQTDTTYHPPRFEGRHRQREKKGTTHKISVVSSHAPIRSSFQNRYIHTHIYTHSAICGFRGYTGAQLCVTYTFSPRMSMRRSDFRRIISLWSALYVICVE